MFFLVALRQQCVALLRLTERRGGVSTREGALRRVRKSRVAASRRRGSGAAEVAAPPAEPPAAARLESRLAAHHRAPGAHSALHRTVHGALHAALDARFLRAARRGPLSRTAARAACRPPAARTGCSS